MLFYCGGHDDDELTVCPRLCAPRRPGFGPSPVVSSDEIIAIGRKFAVTLLHPGYGLKSEDHVRAARPIFTARSPVASRRLALRSPAADEVSEGEADLILLPYDQDFATLVEKAGIIWLGPRPDQILSMGLKHEARKAAIAAGVPVLAGTGLLTTVEDAVEQADCIGYPLMLKASAGGGGMGMELCEDAEALRLNFEKTVGKALVSALALLRACRALKQAG